MPREEDLQLNLGVLRSEMTLTLHTHHASRIWHGRSMNEERPGIIGLNGYINLTNKMKRGAELDDPFSDWWMVLIEQRVDETKTHLQSLHEQVRHVLASVPPTLSLGENLNVHPVRLPLYVGSPLGFSAIYLLTEFDSLARHLLLAHHVALIERRVLEGWLNDGSHSLRSLFGLAQRYRYSGTNRGDCKAQNGVWRAAVAKFGMPPPEVITGELRSRFAPPLRKTTKTVSQRDESDEDVEQNDASAGFGRNFVLGQKGQDAKTDDFAEDDPIGEGAPANDPLSDDEINER